MNLFNTTSALIGVLSPQISITWMQSIGYTTDASGKRTPTFQTSTVQAQIQGLSASDLRHIDGLNIQGEKRSVHLYGNVQGVNRADQQGGDILQFPEVQNGPLRSWRVINVMETWPSWCRVIVVLQT